MTIQATLSLLAFAQVLAATGWSDKTYQPSKERLANPERGLYVELDDRHQRPLESVQLRRLTDDGITLVQRLYYLKGYRDRPLDRQQLDLIEADFDTIREGGMKVILRFAYSSQIGEPDAPLNIVLGHIEQLKPVLQANSDLILTVQAGFIGAWGEWHASTNQLTTPDAMRAIATALLKAIPPDRTIQVRTPAQKMYLVGSTKPLSGELIDRGSLAARIGHHNDCFLADSTDTGTYRTAKLEIDRTYVAIDSQFVPVGGETCREGPRTDTNFARDEMARMHWSFLNLAYHRRVIAKWQSSGFLEEVRLRLGYRLRLGRLRLNKDVPAGGALRGKLTVHNDGFAAPLHNRPVELLLVDCSGKVKHRSTLDVDLRDVYPGVEVDWPIQTVIPANMPAGDYAARLWLPDPSLRLRDDRRYALRLANQVEKPTSDGSIRLDVDITIRSQLASPSRAASK
ncbi:DUF4832 domain-containing protein [Botrimarina hoheduenensis]|uniref:DUF4832 domain-containing protein n=1 Tax=Botrimarina hoheduenensis TaxID=2528000 RepID=A0A5C5W8I8_9BACT|nr:DUF4832 domain-containing protein [Botrimarina hoheduenensis]TWT47206.1 hypothetical protein Pla111_08180 [Botrimarina hoheduenensis]